MSIYIPADCVTVQSTHELPVGSGMIEIPAADVLALMAALGTPVTESEIIVQFDDGLLADPGSIQHAETEDTVCMHCLHWPVYLWPTATS